VLEDWGGDTGNRSKRRGGRWRSRAPEVQVPAWSELGSAAGDGGGGVEKGMYSVVWLGFFLLLDFVL
jgi:hypothetical protein